MSTSAIGIEQLSINTIRTLAMDAVEAAGCGHPGTPMALAPVVYTLFNRHLRFDPEHPDWPARDRFVLSCGHASMLLYATLHLCGVKQVEDGTPTGELAVPLEHIKNFRQVGSRCPGHPEYRHTSGVETTTGPLGQGAGNTVGMAIAQAWLASYFGRDGFNFFDYNTYALVSDGDLMEGLSAEAASLAGHLRLANLCWLYDDNRITIEGSTSLAYTEDVARRFEGHGWNVLSVDDANDLDAIDDALRTFQQTEDRPTLIKVRSRIACGAPNAENTSAAHGAALGDEEVRLTKAAYIWPTDATFLVPEEVPAHFSEGIGDRGRDLYAQWNQQTAEYEKQHPQLASVWHQIERGELPAGWDAELPNFEADAKGIATRSSSGKVLGAVAQRVPWLLGGSADLAPSTKTLLSFPEAGDFQAGSYGGRNLHFGVREHAMGAILSGMALSKLRAYGATFFVFCDYMRPSMRLAAMMQLPVIYVFTHDSIGVGEDGPTHQPVEHLAALRSIPGLIVIRPGDANEVTSAWRSIMEIDDSPVALILSRQNLPTLDRETFAAAENAARGGYVLTDGDNDQVLLIANGSELAVTIEARERLLAEGIGTRVVSMPSWELFEKQPQAYRETVLPPDICARVAVEAGIRQGWERYLGDRGRFVGMDGFGASAPMKSLYEHFGITVDNIVAEAKAALADE